MKALCLVFFMLFLTAATPAQTSAGGADAPDVAVTQVRWRREVYNPALSDDPFRANDEQREWLIAQKETDRQNVSRERRGQNRIPPPSRTMGGVQPANPVDAQRSAGPPPSSAADGQPWVGYVYEAKIGNTGKKRIRMLLWEYVLTDPDTQREVGNHRFWSEVSIDPGKSKTVVGVSEAPPSRVIDVTKVGAPRRGQYLESVLIRRIEYADGSVWEDTTK